MEDKTLETVQKYLEGSLSGQDLQDFELMLNSDEELAEQVSIMSKLDGVLFEDSWEANDFTIESDRSKAYLEYFNDKENVAFYEELKGLSTNSTNKSKPKNIWIGRIAAIAAVFAGLLVAMNLFLGNPSNDKLFSKYSDYSSLPSSIEKSGESSALNAAEDAFETEDYEVAADQFKLALEGGENDEIARLKYAISLAETGRIDAAILQVESISMDSNSLRQADASFYQGLFYIKNGNRDAAITSLQRIGSDSPHFKPAKKILSAID